MSPWVILKKPYDVDTKFGENRVKKTNGNDI